MDLWYSNLPPLKMKNSGSDFIESFSRELSKCDEVDIAVGYVSQPSLTEINRLIKIIRPPIVGVPSFLKCVCGPSLRMGCRPFCFKKTIRRGPIIRHKINAVSKAILQKSYECGMMSKATYDSISDMYEFYIPLRGFDEKTSAEAYSYLAHRQSAFNAPIKKAEGRRSKADDPFANLQSMAESAIMQGNRNKLVKQRFLNFALNHPSDLVSISDLWLQYDSVTDEWKPVFPDNIKISDRPETVEQKMHDFEDRMKQLEQQFPDLYKRGRDAENIPYRVIDNRDLRQHQVVVKRGGRDYVITINGNPRAAQALNGQTNPDNETSGAFNAVLRAGEKLNRQLSAFYTTRNPDFIVSNFMRDMLYTNTMAWIKESPNYALHFHRNYLTKANPGDNSTIPT